MYYVDLTDHNLKHAKVFGSQHIIVECKATLTHEKQWHNKESYSIEYYRDPISGEVRSVVCLPRPAEETTENTLTVETVQDLIWDHLQK